MFLFFLAKDPTPLMNEEELFLRKIQEVTGKPVGDVEVYRYIYYILYYFDPETARDSVNCGR